MLNNATRWLNELWIDTKWSVMIGSDMKLNKIDLEKRKAVWSGSRKYSLVYYSALKCNLV